MIRGRLSWWTLTMTISPAPGGPAVTCSVEAAVLQASQETWIWTGVVLGVAAGLLGAYAGWKSAGGSRSGSASVGVAGVTLVLALGLGVVTSRIRLDPAHRLILLLPVAVLGYWFIRQVIAIHAARGGESGDDHGRCHRK